MKNVLKTFAAVGALSVIGSSLVEAQPDLGGFPIREPGGGVAKPGHGHGHAGKLAEVIVSQANGSRVKTVAAAMKLVKPGGTILVQGGTYHENLNLTKPVSIRGVPDAYGRQAIFRPASDRACVTVSPDTPFASVNISSVVFQFAAVPTTAACIDVAGGNFTLEDSFIVPSDSDIPFRASYGPSYIREGEYRQWSAPTRDKPEDHASARPLQEYHALHARHGQRAGADHLNFDSTIAGTTVEGEMHARGQSVTGHNGPSAGIKVIAGNVQLINNVVIGTGAGVKFESDNGARISGKLHNNFILGNGIGVSLQGTQANLVLANNTIRYNFAAGVRADIYDGLQIISNEISGNTTGIDLAAKVRMVNITSNVIVQNKGNAIRAPNGFSGMISANTIAGNAGCTVQFYSAEQKILNNRDVKLDVYDDFQPVFNWESTNYADQNIGDYVNKKRKKRSRRNKNRNANVQLVNGCNLNLGE